MPRIGLAYRYTWSLTIALLQSDMHKSMPGGDANFLCAAGWILVAKKKKKRT